MSNCFGQLFRISTWGESHGSAIGVLIDGCPAGIRVTEELLYTSLKKRSPGFSRLTSPRQEQDRAHILSGVYEGRSTGAPIAIQIENLDTDSSKYEPIKDLLRPGHANYTYLQKYGVFDYRGGGRSSARETACRVAAGAIAKELLREHGISITAFLREVAGIRAQFSDFDVECIDRSQVFCPSPEDEALFIEAIQEAKREGDSVGGVVEFHANGVPAGWGEPIYNKLESQLASAMMSINASKGFEIGDGFQAASLRGSENNDEFYSEDGQFKCKTNHAGGVLAGISNGMPIVGRVAFKPTSSISKTQKTVNLEGIPSEFSLPSGSRHDPCVAIRAVPVVEAMCALVLADMALLQQSRTNEPLTPAYHSKLST